MVADTASVGRPGDVPCPDPSAHDHKNQLSAQASTAALYVTNPERRPESRASSQAENPLGPDGKLSSKSAATSLKYAKAQDLPSFPSHGIAADSAGKAALLAKDYKMKDLWQPEQSLAGSKAAILAAGRGGKVDLWQAQASADGHSAATLAMRNKGLSPNIFTGSTDDNKSKALLAATMSHNKGRQRAGSTPVAPPALYPDAQNSTANALNAATVSHRASAKDGWNSESNQAARIKNLYKANPEAFGEHPQMAEDDESRHQAALRASAISMAKSMYETQNRDAMLADPDGGDQAAGAVAAHARSSSTTQPDLKQEAMRYISLQETAHRLAAERLAKVDKDMENSRYREYYGYDNKPKRLSSRMSMRSAGGGRQRKRASSEGSADYNSDDEEQARRIRSQMANLSTGMNKVDSRKQQDDRAKLLAAAEKRVTARLHNMDEKVFADTGKVSPALQEEWESKARERAQKQRDEQAQHPGKTHIGGGKFMDQSEIEAIAAARLKPTMDALNETADRKRAHDEEMRLEKEELERQKREERATKKEEKDEQKRIKNEEKATTKKAKDEEKARKEEEKRIAREEQRKSREVKREDTKDNAAAVAGGATVAEDADKTRHDDEPATDTAAVDGREKHRSALSRLKDRFRKGNEGEEAKNEPTISQPVATGATAGLASGAVTAAELDEEAADRGRGQESAETELTGQPVNHAESIEKAPAPAPMPMSPVTVREDQEIPTAAAHGATTSADEQADLPATSALPVAAAGTVAVPAIIADDDDLDAGERERSSRPGRAPFEQMGSFSGLHNDPVPTLATTEKPDLERHISRIPDSDDSGEESDYEDWNEGRTLQPTGSLGQDRARAIAGTAFTAPVVDPIPTGERMDETMAQYDNQRAETPTALPGTLQSPGVPEPAPAADVTTSRPAVTPASPATVKSSGADSDLSIKATKGQDAATTAPIAAAAGTGLAEIEPASSNNKKKDDRGKLTKDKPATEDEPDKKGVRGFFNKLRNRHGSKTENKLADTNRTTSSDSKSVPYDSHKAGQKPIVAATGTSKSETAPATENTPALAPVDTGPEFKSADHTGTEGVIGGTAQPDSPSSFQRHGAERNDPDDVSSSGVDEDDVQRGRGGRLTSKLGFGSHNKPTRTSHDEPPSATSGNAFGTYSDETRGHPLGTAVQPKNDVDASDRQNSNTEDEQFEEARDHFDESLAPPPMLAGQSRKNESPVRGTKFQEQL